MKIAIIGSRGYPIVYSGYETFVSELSIRLVEKGYDVYVYCHKALFKERHPIVNGVRLFYLPSIEKKILSQFSHSFLSTLHVLFQKMDLVLYVNSANGPFGILTKLFRKKTAINVDGLEWLRPKWKGFGSKYFYFSSRIATKLFDIVINDSYEMQRIYKKLFNCNSVVIAYGANIRESKRPELITKWGLTKHEYYLVVGRLIPDNNSDLIIREFIKTNSSKKLVIVGDVPYNDNYANKVKSIRDKRVIFTGYIYDQDELAELWHNCYAYLHGHEFGGTNPTMLHALAYGCAICALDTVFNREMLKNGEYGMFFTIKEGNKVELINRIENNPTLLKKFREGSRKRIVENYTWEKITNQYIEIFDRVNAVQ